MAKKPKVKAVTADEIKTATDSYNESIRIYKECVKKYEAIKERLTVLRVNRDTARSRMLLVHARKRDQQLDADIKKVMQS